MPFSPHSKHDCIVRNMDMKKQCIYRSSIKKTGSHILCRTSGHTRWYNVSPVEFVCLFTYFGDLVAIYEIISTYNKRKTSLKCGTTVNTYSWSLYVPHVWDVQGPLGSIYRHPTSLAGFPLIPIDRKLNFECRDTKYVIFLPYNNLFLLAENA